MPSKTSTSKTGVSRSSPKKARTSSSKAAAQPPYEPSPLGLSQWGPGIVYRQAPPFVATTHPSHNIYPVDPASEPDKSQILNNGCTVGQALEIAHNVYQTARARQRPPFSPEPQFWQGDHNPEFDELFQKSLWAVVEEMHPALDPAGKQQKFEEMFVWSQQNHGYGPPGTN